MNENQKMITRSEALEFLYTLIDYGVLNEEIEDTLAEVVSCISMEQNGLHIWGADVDEISKISAAVRADLMTDDYVKECQKICAKYRFGLSKYEEEMEDESRDEDSESDVDKDEE